MNNKEVGNGAVVLPGFAKVTDGEARPLHRAFIYRPQVVEELKGWPGSQRACYNNSTLRPCLSGTLPGRVGVLQVQMSDYVLVDL